MSGCDSEAIELVSDELAAVKYALQLARKGDLVVITADDIDAVWACVSTHLFEPAGNVPPIAPVTMPSGVVL